MNLKLFLCVVVFFLAFSYGNAQENNYFTPRAAVQEQDTIQVNTLARFLNLLDVFKALSKSEVKNTIQYFFDAKESLTSVENDAKEKEGIIFTVLEETLNDQVRFLSVLWVLLAPFYLVYILVKIKRVFINGI